MKYEIWRCVMAHTRFSFAGLQCLTLFSMTLIRSFILVISKLSTLHPHDVNHISL